MCPSYRVTRDEQHLTRGRANTLRLALSGQLGPDALVSDEMRATMDLCVSCKGCKRDCPTGVDMARMKIEFLNQWRQKRGLALKDRIIATLPRWAPWARSEEHTSELQSLMRISYAVLCLKKKNTHPVCTQDTITAYKQQY